MSAPLLNASLLVPGGAGGGAMGGVAASATGQGPVAGFEGLLAALFAQGGAGQAGVLSAPNFLAVVQASQAGAAASVGKDAAAVPALNGKDPVGKGHNPTHDEAPETPADALLAMLAAAGITLPAQAMPAATASAKGETAAAEGEVAGPSDGKTAMPATAKAASLAALTIATPLDAAGKAKLEPQAEACAKQALAEVATETGPGTPKTTLTADPASALVTAPAPNGAPEKAAARQTETSLLTTSSPASPGEAWVAKTAAAEADPSHEGATPAQAPAQVRGEPQTLAQAQTQAQTESQTQAETQAPAQAGASPTAAGQGPAGLALAQPAPAAAPQRAEAPPRHRDGARKGDGKLETAALTPAKGPTASMHDGRTEGPKAEAPVAPAGPQPGSAEEDHTAHAASSDAPSPTGASDQTAPAQAAQSQQVAHAQQIAVRGAPQTVANLAAQIVKKLDAKTTRFDVQLDPAGLGKVDVRVEIGAEGRITAALACHNPEAQRELQARSGELRQALEQAGFDLAGGGLSFEMAGGGNGQAGAGQSQTDGGQAFRGRAFAQAIETVGEAQAAADGGLRLRLASDRGVDIRI